MLRSLVGSEMCIRDRCNMTAMVIQLWLNQIPPPTPEINMEDLNNCNSCIYIYIGLFSITLLNAKSSSHKKKKVFTSQLICQKDQKIADNNKSSSTTITTDKINIKEGDGNRVFFNKIRSKRKKFRLTYHNIDSWY